MDSQLQSLFFGTLPREIRDMIYIQFWRVSGTQQHVFEHEGVLSHAPCVLQENGEDSRNNAFEQVWHQQQGRTPKSMVQDAKWAKRMSSSWHEHWRCEESMAQARKESNKTATLFLSSQLTCKRMTQEASPSLYSHLTLVITSLPLCHTILVAQPLPIATRLRSLELSLEVPYAALHNHNYNPAPQSNFIPRQNLWIELCSALSNLALSAGLEDLVLRLDLPEDDRFWWEVRETWALGALTGPLRQRTRLYLPELTVDVDRMRPFQYTSEGETPPAQRHASQDYASFLHPMPLYLASPPVRGKTKWQKSDFKDLMRYGRRRWTRAGEGDGVEARLEFFSPRDHLASGLTIGDKMMKGLFRGMLFGC